MQNSKKLLIGTSALVAVILAGAYSVSSAYRGDYSQKGSNYSEERHEAMEEAFENKDYNAWKELMGQNTRMGRVTEVVNEENFSKFARAHELMEQGKYEEARQIREELGLGLKNGEGRGSGRGKGFDGANRGQNLGGNFADQNGDGVCDRMQ